MEHVVLPWSMYNSLDPSPAARTFATYEEAVAYATDSLDEIVSVDSAHDAIRLVAAYNKIAACDWTPNQSPAEREENELLSREANRVIENERDWSRLRTTLNRILDKK